MNKKMNIAKCLLMLAFLMPALGTNAQNSNGKNGAATINEDSIPTFRGVAVGVDLVGAIQRAASTYGQYEAFAKLNIKDKYFPTMEIGLGEADSDDATTHNKFKTSAPYGRIGCDFNIMKNKHDINRVYAGFRYGFTSFKYDVENQEIIDPVWGDKDVRYIAEGVKANYHWLEAVIGLDAKIAGPLRLGWSVRYKRRLSHKDGEVGSPWYVPGYGRSGNTRLGATFNVTFQLGK
ncbi:MAG: DUF6048 family protein [Prevotella sp.]|nr:DUF6048 family protein [Prevotella sp.]